MISMRAVAEQANHRGIFALDDLHHAAFGAPIRAAAGDAGEHVVAVHGVFERIAADEEVAFHSLHRVIWNKKGVAVAMGGDAAGD